MKTNLKYIFICGLLLKSCVTCGADLSVSTSGVTGAGPSLTTTRDSISFTSDNNNLIIFNNNNNNNNNLMKNYSEFPNINQTYFYGFGVASEGVLNKIEENKLKEKKQAEAEAKDHNWEEWFKIGINIGDTDPEKRKWAELAFKKALEEIEISNKLKIEKISESSIKRIWEYLFYIYESEKNYSKTQEALEKVFSKDNSKYWKKLFSLERKLNIINIDNPFYWDFLSWDFYYKKNYIKAKECLEKSIAIFSEKKLVDKSFILYAQEQLNRIIKLLPVSLVDSLYWLFKDNQ